MPNKRKGTNSKRKKSTKQPKGKDAPFPLRK
jgi:hypothetical protein